ncbi:MAG: hypothetical protein K5622_01190 [Endomicrobiaceae bacterium]|nr:hypothetical protein [Endomicrobiaceae bacterium]
MNNYKLFLKLFLLLFLSANLFADVDSKKEKQYSNISISGNENSLEKKSDDNYEVNGIFSAEKYLCNKNYTQYNITGTENKFNLSDNELKNTYNIDGTEEKVSSKKLFLTKSQEAQIDYLEMERKYKILALDKEIILKKKMLYEELVNDFSDVFLIEELSKDIKLLAVDKETVNINVDKKIRYVLSAEQYLKYKQQQNKKDKKSKE